MGSNRAGSWPAAGRAVAAFGLAARSRRTEPAVHRQLDPAEARRNWPAELLALLPALTVGALAVSDWIAHGALSTATFCLILIVGVLGAVRHQVVGHRTRQLNQVLARQVERAQAEREQTRQVRIAPRQEGQKAIV